MMWRSTLTALLFAMLTVASGAGQSEEVSVKIVSPDDDTYVTGPIVLKAAVKPSDGSVTVVFFADGKQVCRLSKAPFECEWDAGQAIAEHQIRVVVTGGGKRVVDTLATKGAGITETMDVELVYVTASVLDGKKYVRGLPKTAFRVLEDDRPQTITHFMAEGAPLDLVLAIDLSSSMTDAMPQVKAAVKEFLTAISPRDHVTVLGFNDNVFTLTRRSSDPEARLRAIDRVAPWGATALYDVVISGINTFAGEATRKAIVVFTDGEDQGSHAALTDVERQIEASGVSLFMIGEGRGVKMEPLKKVMTRLATVSGGRAIMTENITDLREAFADVLAELSNQYLIGFTSTNTKRDGALRRLKVEVEGRHHVRARDAYRAPVARQ